MIGLYILLGIIGLLLIGLLIGFVVARKNHAPLFNHRQGLDDWITYYDYKEFNLNRSDYDVYCKGKKIKGYFYFPDKFDENKIIVFCHGMFSSIEGYIQEICSIASRGFKVLGFDYLGVVESDGKNQMGFGNSVMSTDYVLRALKQDPNYKDKELYLVGHSWGGFAATNAIKYHPDVKGVVGLAPLTSICSLMHNGYKQAMLVGYILTLYDSLHCGKYSYSSSLKSLKNYPGRALIIQSTDDPTVAYESALGWLESNLKKDNIQYITLENKGHFPQYTFDACNKYMKFSQDAANCKNHNEFLELCKNTNFHELGEMDQSIVDLIIEFIKK